jgi:hypothetical protein
LPFLHDVEIHVRLLIALPLMIVAELIVHQRMRPVVAQFLERGLASVQFAFAEIDRIALYVRDGAVLDRDIRIEMTAWLGSVMSRQNGSPASLRSLAPDPPFRRRFRSRGQRYAAVRTYVICYLHVCNLSSSAHPIYFGG